MLATTVSSDPTLQYTTDCYTPTGTVTTTVPNWSGVLYQAFSFMQVGDKLFRMNPYTGQCWQLTYNVWTLIQEPNGTTA